VTLFTHSAGHGLRWLQDWLKEKNLRVVRPLARELTLHPSRVSRLYRPLPEDALELLRSGPKRDLWAVLELNADELAVWVQRERDFELEMLRDEAADERGPAVMEGELFQLAHQSGAKRLLNRHFFKDPAESLVLLEDFFAEAKRRNLLPRRGKRAA